MRQFDNPANPAIHEKTTGPRSGGHRGKIDVSSRAWYGRQLTGGFPVHQAYALEEDPDRAVSLTIHPSSARRWRVSRWLRRRTRYRASARFIPKNLDLSLVDRSWTQSQSRSSDCDLRDSATSDRSRFLE